MKLNRGNAMQLASEKFWTEHNPSLAVIHAEPPSIRGSAVKILPASILAVAFILASLAPAAAAESMVTIYAGPSGIVIPAAALAPVPAQPGPEQAPSPIAPSR